MALAMTLAAMGRIVAGGAHAPAPPWGPPGAFGEALMRTRLSLRGGKVRVTWGGKDDA